MKDFRFTPSLPQGNVSVLLSTPKTNNFSNSEFLTFISDENNISYEIKNEYSSSPFSEVIKEDGLIAVGHKMYFHLFDVVRNVNILSMEVEGYFSHLYYYGGIFYVTDAVGLYAVNKAGAILWDNHQLAIDGVIINRFSDDHIFGSGEMDPPGGWENFTLDRKTGQQQPTGLMTSDNMKKYYSKTDIWLVVILIIALGLPVIAMIYERLWLGLIPAVLFFVFVTHMFLTTFYMLSANYLIIKSGFLLNMKIDVDTIRKISESNNLISSPALSLDRLEILYNKFDTVLISPKEKHEFIAALKQANPAIEVKLRK